jgi:hypothetical protein
LASALMERLLTLLLTVRGTSQEQSSPFEKSQ